MSRARCVPLQYLSNATHGVKVWSTPAESTKSVSSPTQEDIVLPHLTQRDDWQNPTKPINALQEHSCDQMFITSTTMEYEQCQDLSDLTWFEKPVQHWGAVETSGEVLTTSNSEQLSPGLAYESPLDYNLNDFDPFYSMTRSDSMEELKRVAAPMEVAPMLATLPMSNFIKTECNDEDVVREEEVGSHEEPKADVDFLKMDPDMLLMDSPDLLSELNGRDLIDYIISEGSPRSDEPSSTVTKPLSALTPKSETIPAATHSASRSATAPKRGPVTPLSIPPSPSSQLFKKDFKPAMKETYLAIPRELTAGSTDDKKIPKMLILKTPQTSTINLHDLGISIAERIKTIGKRPRPKRFSESADDDDDDEDYHDSEEESGRRRNNKRARRISSSSSTSLSDRYRELRDKNNEASRKSRQNRKEKERDLMKTLELAERQNLRLRTRSDELEKLVHSLRKLLLQIVVSKGSSR